MPSVFLHSLAASDLLKAIRYDAQNGNGQRQTQWQRG
jgi:hypothetical protein